MELNRSANAARFEGRNAFAVSRTAGSAYLPTSNNKHGTRTSIASVPFINLTMLYSWMLPISYRTDNSALNNSNDEMPEIRTEENPSRLAMRCNRIAVPQWNAGLPWTAYATFLPFLTVLMTSSTIAL